MLSAVYLYTSALDKEIVRGTLSKCWLLLIAAVVSGHPACGESWSGVSELIEGENAVLIQERRG